MIATRGYGRNVDNPSSIVSYGYGRRIVIIGWQLIKEFVLRIQQKYEVNLER